MLENLEPSFDISFAFDIINQLDGFVIFSHDLGDCSDNFFVGAFLLRVLVEGNSVNGIEKFLKIVLNGSGLWTLG